MNSGAKVFSAKTELRAFMREDIFFLFPPSSLKGKGGREIPILKFETPFESHSTTNKRTNNKE